MEPDQYMMAKDQGSLKKCGMRTHPGCTLSPSQPHAI